MCSCNDAESPDFYEETWPRATKHYRCNECGGLIPAGHLYQRVVGKWEGMISTHRVCGACSAWSAALRDAQQRARYDAGLIPYLEEPCIAPMGELWSCIEEFTRERLQYEPRPRSKRAA